MLEIVACIIQIGISEDTLDPLCICSNLNGDFFSNASYWPTSIDIYIENVSSVFRRNFLALRNDRFNGVAIQSLVLAETIKLDNHLSFVRGIVYIMSCMSHIYSRIKFVSSSILVILRLRLY